MEDLAAQDLSDLELIRQIKDDGSSEAFEEILSRHTGIYLDTLSKYAPKNGNHISHDDMVDNTKSNIYDAVLKYDPTRGAKFPTFLGNDTRWKCLNMSKRSRKYTCFSLDSNPSSFETGERLFFGKRPDSELVEESCVENISKHEILLKLDIIINRTDDPRVREIFDLRYNPPNHKLTPWKRIAKKLNMSIQGVIDIHNKFIEKARYEL